MSDDNTGAQSDDKASKGTEGTDDTSNANGSTQDDAGTSNGTSSSDTQGTDTVSRAEFDKLDARMRAADKRAQEAEDAKKALEREKMSEQEKVAAELKDVSAERDSLQAELRDTKLENAFLSMNKHTWHDPQDALRLLDMEGVEINEQGKVTGLAEAVEKLAKAKPHLLKIEEKEDGKGSSAASGTATNGKRKGDDKQPPKNYNSRFPALRKPAPGTSASK